MSTIDGRSTCGWVVTVIDLKSLIPPARGFRVPVGVGTLLWEGFPADLWCAGGSTQTQSSQVQVYEVGPISPVEMDHAVLGRWDLLPSQT